jgi:hypothetical protein
LISENPVEDARSTIVVENARKWLGDQRLGAFHVALDGKKAGVAFPGERLDVACAAGPHTVRIRQWWYRSQPVPVDVKAGEEVCLVADAPRDGNVMVRMAKLIFRPSRSLTLGKKSSAEP